MTLDVNPAGIPANRPDPERPADPRPAWERVAYAWLAREADAGQPVDPATLAREVSVAPDLVRDLLGVLRAQRLRDPDLTELRARLARDRITDAYLRRELAGDQRLDPATLAAEVGINQTRKELGVSDRALRTAWRRHGLGLPPRPSSDARTATRRLDAAFLRLNRKLLPARARSEAELAARVRRAEDYAVFGAEVVVEMGSETYGKRPAARVWAITRRAQRADRRQADRQQRGQRRQADRANRTDRTSRARAPVQERQVTADAR